MNENGSNFSIRTIIGFICAPLLPSVLYTWLSWGEAFFPVIFVVMFVAYLLALIVLLPIYLIIFRKRLFNLYSSSFLSFIALFVVFALFFISMGAGYNSLTSGSEALVKNGSMTVAGYERALHGAFIIGLFGMLGGLVFSIFVRGRKLFSVSFC